MESDVNKYVAKLLCKKDDISRSQQSEARPEEPRRAYRVMLVMAHLSIIDGLIDQCIDLLIFSP